MSNGTTLTNYQIDTINAVVTPLFFVGALMGSLFITINMTRRHGINPLQMEFQRTLVVYLQVGSCALSLFTLLTVYWYLGVTIMALSLLVIVCISSYSRSLELLALASIAGTFVLSTQPFFSGSVRHCSDYFISAKVQKTLCSGYDQFGRLCFMASLALLFVSFFAVLVLQFEPSSPREGGASGRDSVATAAAPLRHSERDGDSYTPYQVRVAAIPMLLC